VPRFEHAEEAADILDDLTGVFVSEALTAPTLPEGTRRVQEFRRVFHALDLLAVKPRTALTLNIGRRTDGKAIDYLLSTFGPFVGATDAGYLAFVQIPYPSVNASRRPRVNSEMGSSTCVGAGRILAFHARFLDYL
jgi:hypothetical protein